MRRNINNFDFYREISARFNSTATCGHEVKKGEIIGYNPRNKKTQCSNCWARWVAENREADAIEAGYLPQVW